MALKDEMVVSANDIFRSMRKYLSYDNIEENDMIADIPVLRNQIGLFAERNKLFTGIESRENIIDEQNVASWKYMLETFKKSGDIVWNFEKRFPACESFLNNYFELDTEIKMVQMFLIGVVIRGVKKSSKVAKDSMKQPKQINNRRVFASDSNKKRESNMNLFERFTKEPFSEIAAVTEILSCNPDGFKLYLERMKELVPWHLIYLMTGYEVEKEKRDMRKDSVGIAIEETDCEEGKSLQQVDFEIFQEYHDRDISFADGMQVLMKNYFDMIKKKEIKGNSR